ncbi:TPA: hypothetical protein ACH3X1_009258 [Trebouxia sp. C0004]
MRQVLTFVGKAADKVAAELAPFTVTKTQHFKVLLEMLNQPNGLLTKSEYRDRIHTLNSHPEDSILVVKNITPEWLAGMFDGDGGITVIHNEKAGRSCLEISITQEKCPALLKAIQALYPGTMQFNPHRLKVDITKDPIVFKVDITKDPIVGAGFRGAFTCPNPTKGWTAEHWRDYLHEPLSAWSR